MDSVAVVSLVGCTIAAVIATAVFATVGRGGRIRKLVSDDHLAELANALGPACRAALDLGAAPIAARDDARVVVTSAGARLLLIVTPTADGSWHYHASVGESGGHTSRVVGELLLALWARELGLRPDEVALGPMARGGVVHGHALVDVRRHAEIAQRAALPVIVADVTALRCELDDFRRSLRARRQTAAA